MLNYQRVWMMQTLQPLDAIPPGALHTKVVQKVSWQHTQQLHNFSWTTRPTWNALRMHCRCFLNLHSKIFEAIQPDSPSDKAQNTFRLGQALLPSPSAEASFSNLIQILEFQLSPRNMINMCETRVSYGVYLCCYDLFL